jgi:hypothetical protein
VTREEAATAWIESHLGGVVAIPWTELHRRIRELAAQVARGQMSREAALEAAELFARG